MSLAKAMVLIGSPKGKTSTSASLGTYLIEQLKELDVSCEQRSIYPLLRKQNDLPEVFHTIAGVDHLIIAFPLYIDTLPAGVIEFLELFLDFLKHNPLNRKPEFSVIINCGFPEAAHARVAVRNCEEFARQAHFAWKGAITLGMGGVFGERPLKQCAEYAQHVLTGLEITAKDLYSGNPISREAINMIKTPIMPNEMYTSMAKKGWNQQAEANGVEDQMYNKPLVNVKKNVDIAGQHI